MIDEGFQGFAVLVSALLVGLPLVVGAGLTGYGVLRWRRARALAAAGVRAGAVVVDNQQEARGDSVVFRPVVQFRTSVGQDVRTVVETAVSNRSHLTGTPMEVLYDPADPRHATRAGDRTGGGVAAVVAGLVFLGFAVLAFAFAMSSLHFLNDSTW